MESPSIQKPTTFTDLTLDQLKIMFRDRLSARRMACAENKHDLLKYLWKVAEIENSYLEKYAAKNLVEFSRYDDPFSRHFLAATPRTYTGQNEYGEFIELR